MAKREKQKPAPSSQRKRRSSLLPSSTRLTVIACLTAAISLIAQTTPPLIVHASTEDDPSSSTSNSECPSTDSDQSYNEAVLQAWPSSKQIDHIPFSEMRHSRIVHQYMRRRRPVVIVGLYKQSQLTSGVNDTYWGWEGMQRHFGHVELETKVWGWDGSSSKNCTSGGLCIDDNVTLYDLFQNHFLNKQEQQRVVDNKREKKVPYPHDISLENTLPEMYSVYRKHAFFVENWLLPLSEGFDHWPSLFFGATGTRTGLHVDNFGTSFTMAVFRGRKQFLLIDPKYGPKLCMKRPRGIWEYRIGNDPFNPDFDKCPTARRVVALFANVKAGDVLFVPGSYHHAARNLENSVGVSQNFLTLYDYPSIVESSFGYAANRIKKEQPSQHSADVTMEFLAIRDMFLLLPDTGLFDSKETRKQWWNATEAKVEAYERVMRHMESVVKTALNPMKVASRLAYFVNRRTMKAALKAINAWDCLDDNGGQDIILQEPVDAEAVAFEMWERLEKVFALPADVSCQSIYQAFIDEVQSRSLPNAMQLLQKELKQILGVNINIA